MVFENEDAICYYNKILKMKVILAFPAITTDYGLPRTPPLGISYLGTVLEKTGYKVKLIDLRLPKYNNEYFIKTLKAFKPDIVGVSATSFGYLGGKEIFALTKEYSSKTITILGGPHAAIGGMDAIKDKNLDMLAIGEGEELILELLDSIKKKNSFKSIRGLVYKDKRGSIHTNIPRPITSDLNKLPFPKLNLLPLEEYRAAGVLTLPIMTSRGCPYGCIYCVSWKTQGKMFRGREPKHVVDEIESLVKKFDVSHFTILDDNFAFDKKRAIEICNEIIKRGLSIKWQCDQGIRADRTDYEVYKAMKESGCTLIAIGVENPDPEVLKKMNKGEVIEDIKKSIRAAKKAGLIVKAFFIVGCPGDNLKLVKKSIQFFKEMDIDLPRYSMMTAYPGSVLWSWAEKNGRFLSDPFKYTVQKHDNSKDVQFETDDFSAKDRLYGFKLANDEAEKWIIRYKLKEKFGKKLAYYLYPLFELSAMRYLTKKLYQMKLIRVVD